MITALVEAVTGWHTSLFELLEVGERAVTMARMFNVREGISAAEDGLPDRFFDPLHEGDEDEKRLDRAAFGENIRLYYQAMGWDAETAVPTEGRLAYLRLEWLMAS
jgi:aldehyde:ferredoxin oxidoreductase